jgi:hypothetical protein
MPQGDALEHDGGRSGTIFTFAAGDDRACSVSGPLQLAPSPPRSFERACLIDQSGNGPGDARSQAEPEDNAVSTSSTAGSIAAT